MPAVSDDRKSTRRPTGPPRPASWLVLVLLAVLVPGCAGSTRPGIEIQPGLRRVVNGLLLRRSFTTASPASSLSAQFEINGSAPSSQRWVVVRRDGLLVGVLPGSGERFQGAFAVTRAAFPAGGVFHVRMSREPGTISSASRTGEAVLAVQTASTKRTGDIDYVVVASVTHAGLTHWEVGYAQGHLAAARTTILWAGAPSADAPLSESISLQTDGNSRLTVYFGDTLVFSSNPKFPLVG